MKEEGGIYLPLNGDENFPAPSFRQKIAAHMTGFRFAIVSGTYFLARKIQSAKECVLGFYNPEIVSSVLSGVKTLFLYVPAFLIIAVPLGIFVYTFGNLFFLFYLTFAFPVFGNYSASGVLPPMDIGGNASVNVIEPSSWNVSLFCSTSQMESCFGTVGVIQPEEDARHVIVTLQSNSSSEPHVIDVSNMASTSGNATLPYIFNPTPYKYFWMYSVDQNANITTLLDFSFKDRRPQETIEAENRLLFGLNIIAWVAAIFGIAALFIYFICCGCYT